MSAIIVAELLPTKDGVWELAYNGQFYAPNEVMFENYTAAEFVHIWVHQECRTREEQSIASKFLAQWDSGPQFMKPMLPPVLDVAGATEQMGLTSKTYVSGRCTAGQIPSFKIGGATAIYRAEIYKYEGGNPDVADQMPPAQEIDTHASHKNTDGGARK